MTDKQFSKEVAIKTFENKGTVLPGYQDVIAEYLAKDNQQNMDESANPDVSEEQVKSVLRTLSVLESVLGDPKGKIKNLRRVIEVLYEVEYSQITDSDIDDMNEVIGGIDSKDAVSLDPAHVSDVVADGERLIDDVEKRKQRGYFEGVELIGSTE